MLGASIIVIDNVKVSSPAVFSALTVKVKIPALLGVPEISPSVERFNPSGKFPFVRDHVIGAVPEAASLLLYAVFTIPSGRVAVVMTGATSAVSIVMDNAFVSLPALLVASTVKLKMPYAVGVPKIVSFDKDKPVGKLPLFIVHAIGVVPVAASI